MKGNKNEVHKSAILVALQLINIGNLAILSIINLATLKI